MQDKEYRVYFLVIDGEVVWRHDIEDTVVAEMANAVFSSNPTIIPATKEQAKYVQYGWNWDGENFINPEGTSNVSMDRL